MIRRLSLSRDRTKKRLVDNVGQGVIKIDQLGSLTKQSQKIFLCRFFVHSDGTKISSANFSKKRFDLFWLNYRLAISNGKDQ